MTGNETVARRYATAVFELAREANKIDVVGRDLRSLYTSLDADDNVRRFFYAPIIDRTEKRDVLVKSLGNGADPIALHLLLLLVQKRREPIFGAIVVEYGKLQQAARGAEPLTIVSARPLGEGELAEMVGRLSKIYNKTFDVTQRVDPSLLGGVQITMGDMRIDGSVSGRLEELSRTLFSPQ